MVESIHGQLNSYLPKHNTNAFNFINSINNLFLNDSIDNSSIIRYDFITKSLLLLIEKENLNIEYNWFDFIKFKHYANIIIKDEKENINWNNLDKFINNIDMKIDLDDDINNNSNSKADDNIVLFEKKDGNGEDRKSDDEINSDKSPNKNINQKESNKTDIISDNEITFNNSENLEDYKFDNLIISEDGKADSDLKI